jgi:hypothetical protein
MTSPYINLLRRRGEPVGLTSRQARELTLAILFVLTLLSTLSITLSTLTVTSFLSVTLTTWCFV